jgi:putative copper export protein
MTIDAISASIRALSFIAMFQGAGMAIFLGLFGAQLPRASARIRSVAVISSIAGTLLIGLHYSLEAARMAGDWGGMLDPDLQRLALHSSVSTVAALRILGLVLVIVALAGQGRQLKILGGVAACSVVVSFVLVGHTAAAPHGAWLRALLLMHVLVVTFWFGSLWPLILVNRMESCEITAAIVEQFSRIAAWVVPVIFVAGLVLMSVLIEGWSGLVQPYGLILLAKICAFAVLMGLAAVNRWRLGPALARGPGAATAFHRSVLLEYALIVGVLAATAMLTTFFSPESSASM